MLVSQWWQLRVAVKSSATENIALGFYLILGALLFQGGPLFSRTGQLYVSRGSIM